MEQNQAIAPHERIIKIRAHTALLLTRYGYSIPGREQIVMALMDEYGIKSTSALMYIRYSKKRIRSVGGENGNAIT